jgi:hypothetical protein
VFEIAETATVYEAISKMTEKKGWPSRAPLFFSFPGPRPSLLSETKRSLFDLAPV